jgi:hypothetical protein
VERRGEERVLQLHSAPLEAQRDERVLHAASTMPEPTMNPFD